MCTVNPFLFLLLLFTCSAATAHHKHRLHHGRRGPRASAPQPQEYLDPTEPAFLLPRRPPSCSLPLLQHDFGDTYGRPPASVPYAPPPGCPAPWTRVVLDLSVACAGEQYDRIAAVWIDGAEVIRTSTAEPSEAGVFWHVRKDVTRYAALLRREEGGVASMMLENIVNDEFTGVYHVNVSLDFYMEEEAEESPQPRPQLMLPTANKEVGMRRNLGKLELQLARKLGLSSPKAGIPIESAKATPLYKGPADLIIPISNNDSQDGSWFRIKNAGDVPFKSIQIPGNAHRAVLEIYVSYHSNDEFWYSNPPNSYIERNNLTTERGNGSFREVYASLDGRFVGSIVPFPVIFTGGINPLFWEPVVALGAFDLPSYNLELTPFLGLLLDGKPHDISIGVADGISFWLLDANLHLWLDSRQPSVTGELVHYQAPKISICRRSESQLLDGNFTIEAGRRFRVSGWVNSSAGNLTTDVSHKLHFKSSVEFTNDGNNKDVRMKARLKTDVTISDGGAKSMIARASYKSRYPLMFMTTTQTEEGSKTYTMRTNLSHVLCEEAYVMVDGVESFSCINDEQDADGWMLVEDHSVLAGSAGTRQTYQYEDDSGSYCRKVITKDGFVLSDNTTSSFVFSA